MGTDMSWVKEQIEYLLADAGVVVTTLLVAFFIGGVTSLLIQLAAVLWMVLTAEMWLVRSIAVGSLVVACGLVLPIWHRKRTEESHDENEQPGDDAL